MYTFYLLYFAATVNYCCCCYYHCCHQLCCFVYVEVSNFLSILYYIFRLVYFKFLGSSLYAKTYISKSAINSNIIVMSKSQWKSERECVCERRRWWKPDFFYNFIQISKKHTFYFGKKNLSSLWRTLDGIWRKKHVPPCIFQP